MRRQADEIRYEHRPHLGSNKLPMLGSQLPPADRGHGGEYRFSCRVEKLDVADGQIRGVVTSSGYILGRVVVLAIGHSARDTYAMLHALGFADGFQDRFQLGLRIEQPQDQVNRHKYGRNRCTSTYSGGGRLHADRPRTD